MSKVRVFPTNRKFRIFLFIECRFCAPCPFHVYFVIWQKCLLPQPKQSSGRSGPRWSSTICSGHPWRPSPACTRMRRIPGDRGTHGTQRSIRLPTRIARPAKTKRLQRSQSTCKQNNARGVVSSAPLYTWPSIPFAINNLRWDVPKAAHQTGLTGSLSLVPLWGNCILGCSSFGS